MSRILKIVFILCTHSYFVFAQQDAQYSHYMFNGLYNSPGYTGIEGVTRITLISRLQWAGWTNNAVDKYGAPASHILSVNSRLPFFNRRTGAGCYFTYDTRGPIVSYEFQPSLAYHVKIAQGTLGIGVKTGIYTNKLRTDAYRVVDPTDPIYQSLINNNADQTQFDLGGGLWYETQKYYGGVGLTHITKNKFSYGTDSISSVLNNHMFITGGYRFKPAPSLEITPTAIVQTDMKQLTYLFGPMFTFNSKYWGGLNLRQSIARRDVTKGGKTLSNDDLVLLIGMSMLKNNSMRLGYAFDLVTSGRKAKAATSHEIMISYMLPAPGASPKPKVRTPRYRHDED
ncbi:MAG: type IX secretion system membrane protein PorP/SprF [Cytophagaceae bacterium]|nr:type IX secretion system membrane protein PorP/SprF [Cytophagaceae bacterium]MDW8457018.1 type IX secretion system membrane protein PorP/SprF [Cytophagaceae bacterium]